MSRDTSGLWQKSKALVRLTLSPVVLAVFFVVLSPPVAGRAEEVELNVTVVEKKPTDTINDFLFDGRAPGETGKVLGATDERSGADKPSSDNKAFGFLGDILSYITTALIKALDFLGK